MRPSTRTSLPISFRAPRRVLSAAGLIALAVTLLAGCDNGPFAVQTRALPAATAIVPNDPEYSKGNQWYLDMVEAPAAWGLYLVAAEDALGGRTRLTTPVAVIDSGIDGNHTDLAGSFATTGIDVVGAFTTAIPNGLPSSLAGIDHGTHVSGLIAARAGNGLGIAGIATAGTDLLTQRPAVVVPVRALEGLNGTLSDLIEALLHVAGAGTGAGAASDGLLARIINMSLGADPSSFGAAEVLLLEAAVQTAVDAGILVVAAAGNGGRNGVGTSDGIDWPARFPAVVAVGSVDRASSSAGPDAIVRSRFSDYGLELELVAPGAEASGWDGEEIAGIVSTYPGDRYATLAGTSMAAPLVAGGAALVWSANPGLSAEELRRILRETAVDLGEPGRDEEFGYGLLNVEAALRVALTTPWGPFEESRFVAPAPVLPDADLQAALRRALAETLAEATVADSDEVTTDSSGALTSGDSGALTAPLLVYAVPGTTVETIETILEMVHGSMVVRRMGDLPNGPVFVVTAGAKDDYAGYRDAMETLATDPRILTIGLDRPIRIR